MRWRWKRQARLIEPRRAANTRVLELETAKEILAEVFQARPSEVEEMIQIRLEKKSLMDETDLWPSTFCFGE
jgi:ribose 1,5-bisphosphokinase PhnN